MRTGNRRSRERALTLLEIAIALLILSLVIVPASRAAINFSGAFTSLSVSTHHMSRMLAVLDRVSRELITGNFASVDPPIPQGSTSLSFTRIVDVQDSRPVFGEPIHIELIPAESGVPDGQDDDGDGLVDEWAIRIWEDLPPHGAVPGPEDLATIVCENATEDGLQFTRQGALLLVDVTFQHVAERGEEPTRVTLRSGIKLRNNE